MSSSPPTPSSPGSAFAGATVSSWAPRPLTPKMEHDRRLGEACENAVGALVKRADVRVMLQDWLEHGSTHLGELGFKLAAGTPSVLSAKTSMGRQLLVSRAVSDGASGRRLLLRIELFVATHLEFFGRVDAKVQLLTSVGAARSNLNGMNANCLCERALFMTDPDANLLQFGGLADRLHRHTLREVDARVELALREFARRVEETLAP